MLKKIIKRMFPGIVEMRRDLHNWRRRYDMELDKIIKDRQFQHPNTFVRYGKKCFSQTDEDGITLEILRRLNLTDGTFAEFGVGDGTENNTLVLLALGWKGFWVGGEDLSFSVDNSNRIDYQKNWITRSNILILYKQGLEKIDSDFVDVLSLDLDGNDLYFCEKILSSGIKPKLFIAEYNAKFPPPIRFSIEYDDQHVWKGDDYQGASLMSLHDLFEEYGYSLVCCNAATGSNAFFVSNEHISKFPEIPEDINSIYTPPHFFLYRKYGHNKSIKSIQVIIKDDT